MTTRATRSAVIFLLACLIGACTRVGHIQRAEPVRMMTFAGSHQAVAQCLQQRLGGKLQIDSADRLVVYDSVKARQDEGITHYAVTVGKAREGSSFAELRVMRPAPARGPGVPSGSRVPSARDAINEYWKTVRDCAATAKPAA